VPLPRRRAHITVTVTVTTGRPPIALIERFSASSRAGGTTESGFLGGSRSGHKTAWCGLVSRPVAGEKMGDAQHNNLRYRNRLDKQEGAIGTEDPRCAFGLTPPVKRQRTGADFDEPKIFVRSRRQERCVPPPGSDDNRESADERRALESATASR